MSISFILLQALMQVSAPPAKVAFSYPAFLAAGPDRVIYVSDPFVPAVYRIEPDGQVRSLFHGSKRSRTPLNRPRGMALDAEGNLLVCDAATMDVYRIPASGSPVPLTGQKVTLPNGMETTIGEIVQPEAVVVGKDGAIYVSDMKRGAIYRIGDDRTPVKVATVPAPRGMALDADGSLVVVSNSAAQLKRVTLPAGQVTDIVAERRFDFPMSVCVRADGRYVVTDNRARTLWLVSRDGKIHKLVEGDPLVNPTGVATTSDGRLVIADPHQQKIFVLGLDNELVVLAEAKK